MPRDCPSPHAWQCSRKAFGMLSVAQLPGHSRAMRAYSAAVQVDPLKTYITFVLVTDMEVVCSCGYHFKAQDGRSHAVLVCANLRMDVGRNRVGGGRSTFAAARADLVLSEHATPAAVSPRLFIFAEVSQPELGADSALRPD